MYDPDHLQLIWEQEIYEEMKYITTIPTEFHTFEGDHTMVGLAFAETAPAEAQLFSNKVQRRISQLQSKRSVRFW